MTKYCDLSALEPMADPIACSQEPTLQPTHDGGSDVAATSPATTYDGGTNAHPPLWQPNEPQFTKAIAQYYGVSRKSVQQWFQKVKDACPWVAEADLKLPDERYTPLCIALMGRYRTSGLPFAAWKAQLWAEHPEEVKAYQAAPVQPVPDELAPPATPEPPPEALPRPLVGQSLLALAIERGIHADASMSPLQSREELAPPENYYEMVDGEFLSQDEEDLAFLEQLQQQDESLAIQRDTFQDASSKLRSVQQRQLVRKAVTDSTADFQLYHQTYIARWNQQQAAAMGVAPQPQEEDSLGKPAASNATGSGG